MVQCGRAVVEGGEGGDAVLRNEAGNEAGKCVMDLPVEPAMLLPLAGMADAPQPRRMPVLQSVHLMAVNHSQQGGPSQSQEQGEEAIDLEPFPAC